MARKPNARAKHTKAAKLLPLPTAAGEAPASVTLTAERAQLWDDIRARYHLDPASESLLRNGCESLERAAQYAAIVERDGGTFTDRFGGIRAHPCAGLERDFRSLASRTLQQLATRLEGG